MNEDTNIAAPENCWRDYFLAQRTTARAMGQMPIVAGITVAAYMVNGLESGDESALALFLLQCCMWSAVCLSTVVESAKEDGFKVSGQSLHAYSSAFWLFLITSIASMLGLALFVMPGLWITAVTAVGLVVCCVEKKGVMASLRDSIDLSKGHFWYLMRYLGVPTFVVFGLPLLFGMYLASCFDHRSELVERLLLNGISVFASWNLLCMIPLQVKAYRRMKGQKIDSSGLVAADQIFLSTDHSSDVADENQTEIINTKKFEQA